MRYVFGDYTLDVERYELRLDGQLVPVEPRVFDLLAYLVQHPGRTVLTEELLSQLYPHEFAPVERLTNAVAQARRVLHDTAQTQHYIQTVRRRGYRWCVPVTLQPPEGEPRPAPAALDILEAAALAPLQGSAPAAPPAPPLDLLPLSPAVAAPADAPPVARPGLPQAERRQLTVLVCRLVGMAARVAPLGPEELHEVAEAYARLGAEVVRRFDGAIVPQDQGDRLVVYFGYPHAHEDDARRAVHTGLGLVEAVAALNRHSDCGVQLGVRVGIHTGVVIVGARGPDEWAMVALGNTSALADQVQGLATPNTVVISPTTRRLVERTFAVQALGMYILEDPVEPLVVSQILPDPTPQRPGEGTTAPGRTPLVGREQELQLLRARWAQVHDGWGQVVVLSGEAGIGKSRLVQALTDLLTGDAYTRIECRASPYYQQSAFYPLIAHIHRLLRWQPADPPADTLRTLEAVLGAYDLPLAEVVPLFAALLALPLGERYAPLALPPEQQKQQTLAALLTWLLREAERQPVLLIGEDLHWLDPSTLAWLSLLIDQIPMARILLLLTCRPDFQPPWALRSHLTHITLGRLSPRQTEGLITQVVGKPLPVEVLQQVVATTDGVPLFIEELTKMVLELGLVKEQAGRYAVAGPLPARAIPATLYESLLARLDRLGAAKQVAQLGAVVGREFAYAVLQAVAPLEEAVLQQGLARLVEAELLYQRGLPPQGHYTFKHALIQEAAYQSLVRRTRQQYHQQIAQVLEARFPETGALHPELVAHHYTEAALPAQAVPYWERAGQCALQRSAHAEAIGHFTHGLTLLQLLPPTPARTQHELALQLALGTALAATKGYAAAEVERLYTRVRALCHHVDPSLQRFSALVGLWRLYISQAAFAMVRNLEGELVRLAQHLADPVCLQQAYGIQGVNAFYKGEFLAARVYLEQGLAQADGPPPHAATFLAWHDPRVLCLSYAAWTLWVLGYPDQALRRSQEAVAHAQQVGQAYTLARALHYAAFLHTLRREVRCVQERSDDTLALASAQGFVRWQGGGLILRGWTLAAQGEVGEGLAQIHEGLAAFQQTGERRLTKFQAVLAEAYGWGRQTDAALGVLAAALDLVHRQGERYYAAELYRLQGVLRGQHNPRHPGADAEARVQQALAIARRQGAKSLELRAAMSLTRLWQQQGKRAEACALLTPIYGWFTEGFDTADLQEAKALLEELGG